MKKSVLALSVISALFLAGCSSDDDSSSPEPTPEPTESREVAVTIAAAQLLPTSVVITSDEDGIPVLPEYIQQVDNKGYQHAILVKGYDLCYSDEIVTDKCFHNIDIYDATITLDVTGEATITISNPIVNSVDTSPVYTAFGEETLKVEDTQVEIKVTNKDWQYITVESSNDVEASYLNNLSMEWTEVSKDAHRNVDYDYSFGYVLIDSQVVVDTPKYGSLEADTTYEANGRVDLRVNFNENGNIIIGDPSFGDGDSPIIEPVTPVMDENIMGRGLTDYTIDHNTGAVTWNIEDNGTIKGSEANRIEEAFTYEISDFGEKVGNYNLNLKSKTNDLTEDGFDTYTAYTAVYLFTEGGTKRGELEEAAELKVRGDGTLHIVVPASREQIIVNSIEDVVDFYGDGKLYPIKDLFVRKVFGNDATIGNFYTRYNYLNLNGGDSVTISEYNFTVKSENEGL
ncbi:hypothetical protein A9267_11565 [Shewanella sp. UCD-FRSSP16_17]|uniref:hypothetical protein n=1 Tax=Shewanella sp. UCD-FRSSP16_17 TaxID=1853256 RepID=UPI0007EEE635|nr:hypothetical protein [Shewanella sp. UCD-FRSSP16_17]OBT08334.1 hypothetical protein A9267_11565 [Shewanella sp. UCD-FRSSP16_17]